jgi:hypothetical protein
MLFLRYYLWLAPVALLAACLFAFVYRRLQKQFPVFFAYLVLELASSLILVAIIAFLPHTPYWLKAYRWSLVVGTGVTAILAFGALYELASSLIMNNASLRRILRPLPRWSAAALVLLASGLSALLSSKGIDEVVSVFQSLDFSTNLVKIGLLLALVLLSRVLGISWRSLPAGIALGFGISASAEVGASALISELGSRGYITVDLVRMSAFHLCTVIWFIYILLPERRRTFNGAELKISDLEVHLQELQRMVHR